MKHHMIHKYSMCKILQWPHTAQSKAFKAPAVLKA